MGVLLLPAGCSRQANHCGNWMAAALGGGRSLDRAFCCRPGFTDSWPHNSAVRRTPRPSPELRFLGPWARWDRSCSKPHHLSGGLDRGWAWYRCRTLRRRVRDARADLWRQFLLAARPAEALQYVSAEDKVPPHCCDEYAEILDLL